MKVPVTLTFFISKTTCTHLNTAHVDLCTLSGSRSISIVAVWTGTRAPQRGNTSEKTANPYG